jgi:hypothetical protein
MLNTRMTKKNKGYRNKDPKYFDKKEDVKKKLRNFLTKESKKKHGKDLKK